MSSSTTRILPQFLTTTRNTLLRLRQHQTTTTTIRNATTRAAATSNITNHTSINAAGNNNAKRSTYSLSSSAATTERFFSTDSSSEIIPGVGRGKTSTGLVGIPVDHDAIPKLIHKNQALLSKMAASDMPPTAQYYINVAQISNYRIQACHDHPNDPEAIEELCQCGQIEELVIQADNEMIVLDMYLTNRWWEMVTDTEIEYGEPEDDRG
eukprot:CAMPEP_0198254162 /NCGR_PEP_ID=MMETSP1447-20131203/4530_1 /TAXON_ID=420782 /ORGANISM="Chaetoceros dichaeta, Strain CCMP1751" /LENGTH=209 /DNA_ID=CAMNT_0043940125 /DNA_START=193 /DNA_END=818 /DNA_ORIENTATION=+